MAASVITNGNFESGSLSPWFQSNDYSAGTNWGITNVAHTGSFGAFDIGNKEIQQNFAGVAVSSITELSFWIMHPDAGVTAFAYDFFYSDGSSNQLVKFTSGTAWQQFNLVGDLAAGKTLTGFGLFGNSGGSTYLDDVVITTATAPGGIPEPATWALMLVGVGAVGAGMRHKQRQTVRLNFA